jgi:hypothetical protein
MNYCEQNAIYSPTINEQVEGSQPGAGAGSTSICASKHHQHVSAYGPPPRNYFVRRT